MRARSFLTLFAAVNLTACAGTAMAPTRRDIERPATTCLTDPARGVMYCNGIPIQFRDAFDYVCHPMDEWERFLESCVK